MIRKTRKQEKLPPELKTYKAEVKKLSFKEKVKAFFNCSPYLRDQDSKKKDIILDTLNKDERKEFERLYRPIYSGIERYGDRMRAINTNIALNSFYIDTLLRQKDTINYTADFLNIALSKTDEALNSAKDEKTKEALIELSESLKKYRVVILPGLSPNIGTNQARDRYEVDDKGVLQEISGSIEYIKGLLSLLKCYLEALREFLEWVGTPELYPREFYDMETHLINRYKPIEIKDSFNKDFPLWSTHSEVEKEFLSIDYKKLPRTVDLFGENNLFANTYRRFFL